MLSDRYFFLPPYFSKTMNQEIEIDALLIHEPADFYLSLDERKTELKRRFISARKIPYSFIRAADEENGGGWNVRTSDWKNGPLYYHVYKTVYNVWLCSCDDFLYSDLQVCKHIIATILMIRRGANEEGRRARLDDVIKKILSSETHMYFYNRLNNIEF
jgi:hypothetical protein